MRLIKNFSHKNLSRFIHSKSPNQLCISIASESTSTYREKRDYKRAYLCVLREVSRRLGTCVRCCLVIFAVILAMCGPAMLWRFKKVISLGHNKSSYSLYNCSCLPPPLSLLKIVPGNFCFHDFH